MPFNVASDIRIHQSVNVRSKSHRTAPRCTLFLSKWFEQCTCTLLPTRAIPENADLSLGRSNSGTLIADHNCLILPHAILYSLTNQIVAYTNTISSAHKWPLNKAWAVYVEQHRKSIWCLSMLPTVFSHNNSQMSEQAHFCLHMQPLAMWNLTAINLLCKS